MLDVLISILPLDIAATLSPLIYALTIFLLSNKIHQKARLTSFFLGSLAVGVFVCLIGFNLGQKVVTGGQNSQSSAIVDLIIGRTYAKINSSLTT